MNAKEFAERLKNTGRNDECPCGSGKKYKKCHLIKDEEAQQSAMKLQEESAKNEKSDEATTEKSKNVNHFVNTKAAKITRSSNAPRFNAMPRTTGK